MPVVRKVLLIIVSIIMGIVIHMLYESYGSGSRCQILYVSQDELIDIEKERIKSSKLEDRQLFFGKVEEAVELSHSLSKGYEKKKVRVVYTINPISGKGVRSISREVHGQIIKKLSENKQK